MAIGDVYRVQFCMNNNDKDWTTDHYYEESSPRLGTVAQVSATLGVDVQTDFWTNFWKTYTVVPNTYVQTLVQMIYPTREAPVINVSLAGDAGSILDNSINGQVAVLIAQYGVTWNREFQGRAFLAGFNEENTQFGRINAITYALLAASATAFYLKDFTLAGPAGGTYRASVLSPKRLKASTPPVVSEMITATARARISRQVRRRTSITTPAP